jgi:drug/metabolite transporter (DMT)-like permease
MEKNKNSMKLLALFIVSMCGLFGALGQLMLKLGTQKMTSDIFSVINWQIIVGFILYLIATAIFLSFLKYGDISIMFPMAATSYIWTTIFSSIFLNEAVDAMKWGGNAFIIAGIFLIGYSMKKTSQKPKKGERK